jgi:hypothetical protein
MRYPNLRPEGRRSKQRQAAQRYDNDLMRVSAQIRTLVRANLNAINGDLTSSPLSPDDITLECQPFSEFDQYPDALVIEVRLDDDNETYRSASDRIRRMIALDILHWLHSYPDTPGLEFDILEVNLVFVPMSGLRVQLNQRTIQHSWGEPYEPPRGCKLDLE